MKEYRATIGLEIHAELKTATKMFCASKNDPNEERPNVNICPVCLAHPGTLPVINREAVRQVLRVGAALGGKLADYTEFDRKNYFYPDLPKGYQISQYEFPLVSGGTLDGVAITRVHLEEDTASSMHEEATGATLVDFNRAGVPLMELVTEPVIESAEKASSFARELQLLLRYLGSSDANMEKGEMRVEANVSVSRDETLGTKVEIKNLNSFKAMERAVAYEINRQTKLLQSGEVVVQETRGWDDAKQATFPQRIKEGSADYRYFPDPDLPSIKLSELPQLSSGAILDSLPETPSARRERYLELGLRPEDADSFRRDTVLGRFFEEVIANYAGDTARIQLAANYVANDLVKLIRDTEERDTESLKKIPILPSQVATIIQLVVDRKLSSRGAKDLLAATVKTRREPIELATELALFQQSDVSAIGAAVESVLAEHSAVVDEYRAGKEAALQFLIGQGMKALRGSADPAVLKQVILQKINGQ